MVDQINPNRLADSAGVPWEGRSFESNPFAEDDGSAPTHLLEALNSFRAGQVTAGEVVDAIRASRLLVPLLAQLGESEIGPNGQRVDKSADLSIVTVMAPDGANALVVFSSVEAMRLWNKSARPVPTDAVRVALAAASEGITRVVLDPGSETEFVLRRVAIAKVAQSKPWGEPHLAEEISNLVAESVRDLAEVKEFRLASGDPSCRLRGAELEVSLLLSAGLGVDEVRALVDRVTAHWAASEIFAELVDSATVKLEAS